MGDNKRPDYEIYIWSRVQGDMVLGIFYSSWLGDAGYFCSLPYQLRQLCTAWENELVIIKLFLKNNCKF